MDVPGRGGFRTRTAKPSRRLRCSPTPGRAPPLPDGVQPQCRGFRCRPHPQTTRCCASQGYGEVSLPRTPARGTGVPLPSTPARGTGVPLSRTPASGMGSTYPYRYLLLSAQPTPTECACVRTQQRRTARARCPVLHVSCVFDGRVRRLQLRRVSTCTLPRVLGALDSTPAGWSEGTREYSGWAVRGYSGALRLGGPRVLGSTRLLRLRG